MGSRRRGGMDDSLPLHLELGAPGRGEAGTTAEAADGAELSRGASWATWARRVWGSVRPRSGLPSAAPEAESGGQMATGAARPRPAPGRPARTAQVGHSPRQRPLRRSRRDPTRLGTLPHRAPPPRLRGPMTASRGGSRSGVTFPKTNPRPVGWLAGAGRLGGGAWVCGAWGAAGRSDWPDWPEAGTPEG